MHPLDQLYFVACVGLTVLGCLYFSRFFHMVMVFPWGGQ